MQRPNGYSSIPPRKLNGGLYTGEPFASSAWGNVPIVPDSGNMVRNGLRIGNEPPPGATLQYVAWERPGNSSPDTAGLVADEWTGFMFAKCA
jgi:hypothetical protein